MRIVRNLKNPTIPATLLLYFSVGFFWHFVFSFLPPEFDNIYFLKLSATTVSIYWIAKTSFKQNLLTAAIKIDDIPEIAILFTATLLLGIGCWSLLVFSDAKINGQLATEHWGLISRQKFSEVQWSTAWIIGHLIVSSILNPITEEIIFRGFILGRLLERYRPMLAIMISAGLFGAFHFNMSFLGAFVHGLIFGFLMIRTSSIYAVILIHGLYNSTIFIIRLFFGFSIVGDARFISLFTYWAPELLCGLGGLFLLGVYFLIWPFGRYGEDIKLWHSSVKP